MIKRSTPLKDNSRDINVTINNASKKKKKKRNIFLEIIEQNERKIVGGYIKITVRIAEAK